MSVPASRHHVSTSRYLFAIQMTLHGRSALFFRHTVLDRFTVTTEYQKVSMTTFFIFTFLMGSF